MADTRPAPTGALRAWMKRTGTTPVVLADKLAAIGCKVTPESLRLTVRYREPGPHLAAALSEVTGISYWRLRHPIKFDPKKLKRGGAL